LLVAALTTWFLGYWFGDLFPLIEYSSWTSTPAPAIWPVLRRMLLHPGLFNRHFSLLCCQYIWKLSGGDIDIANWVQLAFLAISAAGIFLWVRRLLPEPRYWVCALLAGLAAGCTLPAIDAASWQATNHDKLAVLLTVAAFHLALGSFRREFSLGSVLRANLLVTPAAFLAYNSKEAAWCLAPSLFLLAAAIQAGGARELFHVRPWLRAFVLTALPLAYAVWQHAHWLSAVMATANGADQAHVFGGNALVNLRIFLLSFCNFFQFSGPHIYIPLALTAISVLGLALWRSLRRSNTEVLVPLAGLLGALAIPLFTYYGSYFYLLVPSFYFWWLTAVCLAELLRPRAPAIPAAAFGLALAALLASPLSGFGLYRHKTECARNFRAALPTIAAAHPKEHTGPLCIAYPRHLFFAYQIIGDTGNRFLARFLFPDEHNPQVLATFDAAIINVPYDSAPPTEMSTGTLVILDGEMRLRDIRTAVPALPRD